LTSTGFAPSGAVRLAPAAAGMVVALAAVDGAEVYPAALKAATVYV
jgi:hypothetical protein